jgi:hypothetical protein
MKRVIYSLYVDVPAKEHYGDSKNWRDTPEKANITVDAFKKHYDRLVEVKQWYAKRCDVDFLMFEYDEQYKTFEQNFLKDFPMFTGYEVINFYKIHLLYELSKTYDEILYLDFDVIPFTKEHPRVASFFNNWDLSKGICVYNNNDKVNKSMDISQSIRSPSAKYFNCHAMLYDQGLKPINDVVNTGIIGACKEDIIKLDFFGGFKDTIDLMTKLRESEPGIYTQNIIDMFRYDNETIFSYKKQINNVPIQWLDDKWHYFFDVQGYIPDDTKLVHCINKDFDFVWSKRA